MIKSIYNPTDIETIPDQTPGAYEEFLQAEKENFTAPSDLSKKQALIDMGLDDKEEPQKYWTKPESIKEWENHFAEEKAPEVAEEK